MSFFSSMVDRVMARDEFKMRPPVLLDIGASWVIHEKWKPIAKYSICIAFDPDPRDFKPSPATAEKYFKLHVKNALVVESGTGDVKFNLTKSPYCSSVLDPDQERVKDWCFAPLFELEKSVTLKGTDLPSVLTELGVDRIDWFKTDSQGTDLRLFKSVPDSIRDKVLIAEFEPGILDVYRGEDKLHAVLSFMDASKKFWLSDLELKGTVRMRSDAFRRVFKNALAQKAAMHVGRISPGWGEMTFLNTMKGEFSKRDLLLAWVIATLEGQHGFACEVAVMGQAADEDPIFADLLRYSERKVRGWLFTFRYFKFIGKAISRL